MTWEEAIINNPSSTSNLRGNKIWSNAREENKIKEGMMKNLHIKSKLKVNIMVMVMLRYLLTQKQFDPKLLTSNISLGRDHDLFR